MLTVKADAKAQFVVMFDVDVGIVYVDVSMLIVQCSMGTVNVHFNVKNGIREVQRNQQVTSGTCGSTRTRAKNFTAPTMRWV